MNVQKVERIGGRMRFTMDSERVASRAEIARIQIRAGYSPAGYGGPMSISTMLRRDDDRITTTWECFASCD